MRRPAEVQDRRIQKTRQLLHDAFADLIREKPYDAISVTDVLERANVGRSTFYMHFRDKDELLASGIRAIVRAGLLAGGASPNDGPLSFSLPMFEFHSQHRKDFERQFLHRARKASGSGRAIVHEHFRNAIAELIADQIRTATLGRRKKRTSNLPDELVAQYLASTFVLVLTWWLGAKSDLTASEVDELFRAIVAPAVATHAS